jgi:hypothetical protein
VRRPLIQSNAAISEEDSLGYLRSIVLHPFEPVAELQLFSRISY